MTNSSSINMLDSWINGNNALIKQGANGQLMFSSKLIAKRTNKEHFHVLRDIRNQLTQLRLSTGIQN